MATYYTSSAASGGGDGSSGDPFTLAECDTSAGNVSAGDLVWVKGDGAYTLAADLTLADGAVGTPTRFATYTTTPGDGGSASVGLGDYTLTLGAYVGWFGGTLAATKSSSDSAIVIGARSMMHGIDLAATISSGYPTLISGSASCVLAGSKIVVTGADSVNPTVDMLGGTVARCFISANNNQAVQVAAAVGNILAGPPLTVRGQYDVGGLVLRNVVYDTDGDAIVVLASGGNTPPFLIEDNIVYTTAGYGMAVSGTVEGSIAVINNAIGDVTSGQFNGFPHADIGTVTLTADPFTDAASGDFTLNNTAGGGALCRGAGLIPPTS